MIWGVGGKQERLFLGKQKRILGMLFAMVTQLSLINLSHMKQVPDYNTLKQGSVPRGARPLGCSTSYLQAQCPDWVLCSAGRVNPCRKSHHVPGWLWRRGTPSLLGPPGLPGPATPKAAPQGDEMKEPALTGAAALALGAASISRRKEVFFLHFQDKVSFMRAACWTNQVNWEALNSCHWADPSFLLKADSADREITSALNSFSPFLNFTPISGWGGPQWTCDMGVVQFSFAGSKLFLFGFLLIIMMMIIFSVSRASQLSWCQGHPDDLHQPEWCKLLHCFGKIQRTNPVM